ncbi:1-aminocyclopropane-1-carboxylate synthase-like [Telopea speciosissima]|uniref:1-aminocyclopropane-1-carboxylate synthase-like n=1 Tax=Telopea speciosissima TaxID=54955 RepID=UPI001CC520F3|nr:1-aminocyclopropane-1-carboxylate synthase-like [Telopea speciosissima]
MDSISSNCRFDRDLRWRTGVQLIPVVCKSSNGFKITKAALEEAYEKAQEANINVKGILITNPSNPLGTILDRETLQSIVSFINKKKIHLICDEIYAATVFSQPKFISIAEIIEEEEEEGNCNRDLIHIVYSLSKDMGFPGFRVGILYSYNDEVVNCARKMSSFGLVSTQTQHLIATMLSDDEFVEGFMAESSKRLAKRYNFIRNELSKVKIECLESNAGLFCWMDLRKMLKNPTLEEEMVLWRGIVNGVKLNVSPGSSFHCSEPGWFRVCFANMDDETMEVALKRMQMFVGKPKEEEMVVVERNKRSKSIILRRLGSFSSSRRTMEEAIMPPCILSPQSPLVSART